MSPPPAEPDPAAAGGNGQPPRSQAASTRPLQAAALLSGLYFLGRLTGLVQRSLIGALLPPAATDAYFAAFALPDFVNQLVAGGALSVTFIPVFTSLLRAGDERKAWQFFSALATLMTVVLALVTTLFILLAVPLMHRFRPGLTGPLRDPGTFVEAVAITRIMLPAQMFYYVGGMIVGVLNAYKRFGATGWTGAINNLVAIVVALAFYKLGLGPRGFAWGILAGAICGNFLLPWYAANQGPRESRIQYRLNFNWHQPAVARFFRNAVPIMLGVSLPVVDQIVVIAFASMMAEGKLTHLDNANRIMVAALGIVGQAASVAAFPYMAANSAAGQWTEMAHFIRTGLRRLLFLTLPLSMLMILLARPIVGLVYGYGHYRGIAVPETAVAFAFYSVGLFAWAGQQLVARGFYAMQDTVTPTVIGTVLTIFFFIPLCFVALHWPNHLGGGVMALAMATSIGAAVHFTCILLALEHKLSARPYHAPIHLARVGGTMLRTGVACALMSITGVLATAFCRALLHGAPGKLSGLILIVGVSLVSGGTFALAAERFAIPEWHWLKRKLPF